MNPQLVFDRLIAIDGTTWHTTLAPEAVQLFGLPVEINIETRSNPRDTPVPPISDTEKLLIKTVLENIQDVLAECDRMLQTEPTVTHVKHSDDVNFLRPHIWISREIIDQKGASRWAFVLGIDDNPDFGLHIEFDGLTAQEVWGGD